MGDVKLEDADGYRGNAPVDVNGRVSIGSEFANKDVEVAFKLIGESDSDSNGGGE